MFGFKSLNVYKKAKSFNQDIGHILHELKTKDTVIFYQLRSASISILLNIAEGTGKMTRRDKKKFYYIARGSVYECASILEIIYDEGRITRKTYRNLNESLEVISKMLWGLIRSQE